MRTLLILIISLALFGGANAQNNAPKASLVIWGFRYPFDRLCSEATQNGIDALEFVPSERWKRAASNGCRVIVAVDADMGVERGFCDTTYHKELQRRYFEMIPKVAANKIPMLICYSGIDPSGDWQRAMTNCAVGLTPVVEMAAKYGVTIVMELFSSNRSKELWWQHAFPYYACNSAKKGAELAVQLNLANFKLLYDVWQMNDMGAKVESDISKYGEYIGHYHISGAGRKLWRGDDAMRQADIVQTIVKSGYKGYIGIELLIERDIPLALRTAAELINN